MHVYDTVTSAVSGLKARGYALDFNLGENCLKAGEDRFGLEEFEITEVYRFEGPSDPADEAVVYAIQGSKGHKGILVTGYGTSAEGMSAEMARKLSMHTN